MAQSIRDIKSKLQKLASTAGNGGSFAIPSEHDSDRLFVLQGRALSSSLCGKRPIHSLREVEFSVFSQFGDDGIIQWLINNLEIPHQTFVEFGVADYRESNTRFLMMNDNWSGLVMDGSAENVQRIQESSYYWRHDLTAKQAFVDCDNVNQLISSASFDREIGLLHIDLDGVDYWIWKKIDCVSPIILIFEYNSVFGMDRAITVPYDKSFYRTDAHHSNLYFGASLAAFCKISQEQGYSLVGCNNAGNNAYFVRNDKLNDTVKAASIEDAFVMSKFRESRDQDGQLTYLSGSDRLKSIAGLEVYNVETDSIEKL
ncbi:MAG: hypothetical protein AAF989_01490 [Planctomycetota bacterium]